MKIIDKNGILHLEFYSNSKLITRSLALNNTKQNLKYAQTKLMPIFLKLYQKDQIRQTTKNRRYQNKKSPTLKELCNEYLHLQNYTKLTTLKSVNYALNRIFDFLQDKKIALYTSSELKNSINLMHKTLSASTINLILCYVFSVFLYAKQKGFIKAIPLSRKAIPRPKQKRKFIPNKIQIQNILKHATGELQIFLYIGIYTGARSGEIMALCKEDIDFKNQMLTIDKNQTRFELTTPKNGTSRQVPIPSVLSEFLRYKLPKSGRIFSSDYFSLYYKFNLLLNRLNYPKCGLHITRHIYTNALVSGFISPQFIANSLGHSSLNLINKTYSHFLLQKSEFKKLQKILNFTK